MKAVVISVPGGPEVLQLQDRPMPQMGESEVLIQVKAAGVNRPDLFQRKGHYPAPAGVVPDIPGLELAGIIIEVGATVDRWSVGDHVCCLVAGGAYAEYAAVDEALCLPIPSGLSFEQAAILPETIYTVWDNVFRRGALKYGQHLLVHGGSGGIGSTAIQLAKASGARVSATAGSAEKIAYCKELGADIVVNYVEQDYVEILKNEEVDVILDSIGGDYFAKNIEVLQPDGRLVYINAVKGKNVDLDIMRLMQKRILLTGSTLRARDLAFKAQLTREVQQFIWPLIGQLFKPQLFKSMPLQMAAEAHALLEEGAVLGKIALVI